MSRNFKDKEFTKVIRGYSPEEVDEYLEYINSEYGRIEKVAADYAKKLTMALKKLDEMNNYAQELEDRLENNGGIAVNDAEVENRKREADIAMESARKAIEKAQAESERIRTETHSEYERIISEARAEADKIISNAKADAKGTEAVTAEMKESAKKMFEEISSFRDTLFEAYNSHIESIESLAENAEESLSPLYDPDALSEPEEEVPDEELENLNFEDFYDELGLSDDELRELGIDASTGLMTEEPESDEEQEFEPEEEISETDSSPEKTEEPADGESLPDTEDEEIEVQKEFDIDDILKDMESDEKEPDMYENDQNDTEDIKEEYYEEDDAEDEIPDGREDDQASEYEADDIGTETEDDESLDETEETFDDFDDIENIYRAGVVETEKDEPVHSDKDESDHGEISNRQEQDIIEDHSDGENTAAEDEFVAPDDFEVQKEQDAEETEPISDELPATDDFTDDEEQSEDNEEHEDESEDDEDEDDAVYSDFDDFDLKDDSPVVNTNEDTLLSSLSIPDDGDSDEDVEDELSKLKKYFAAELNDAEDTKEDNSPSNSTTSIALNLNSDGDDDFYSENNDDNLDALFGDEDDKSVNEEFDIIFGNMDSAKNVEEIRRQPIIPAEEPSKPKKHQSF